MVNLRTAKMMLRDEGHSFVGLMTKPNGEEKIYVSGEKGLVPIIVKMDIRKKYFKDAYVADRAVGKAAAMLLVLSGVRGIYADVMSEPAKRFLENVMYDRNMGRNVCKLVEFEARTTVPYLTNGKNSGMCPYEEAVQNLEKYEEAYDILKPMVDETLANTAENQ